MDNSDLRERLRRLGVHRGASQLKTSSKPVAPNASETHRAHPLERARTPFGEATLRRTHFALDTRHGNRTLSESLGDLPEIVGGIEPRSDAPFSLADAIFLDTETTGLAGGAGTLAFLVGVGYFAEPASFVVEQYFLADPARELAMLCELDRLISRREHLVTFNGRAFDVPLLETRFVLARTPTPFADMRHLDLLTASRRVWRNTLTSCSLGSLEFHILEVRRDQIDIPGFQIPQLYREYLQSGDMTEMERVMYHNLYDVLSMVTLAAKLRDVFVAPREAAEHLALARQHEANGDLEQAVSTYRRALTATPSSPMSATPNAEPTRRLATALKRLRRHEEALEYWEVLADAGDVEALLELSKFYEWQAHDLSPALDLAARAWTLAPTVAERDAIAHRLTRLRRKMEGDRPPNRAAAAATPS